MRLRWLTMFVVLAWTGLANAEFITVLSQEYVISGEAHYNGCDLNLCGPLFSDPPLTNSFHATSALSPLSDFVEVFGHAGQSSAAASVDGGVTPAAARISAAVATGNEGDAFAFAFASASITFAPLVERILVTSDHEPESGFGVIEILDLTTGLPVYTRITPEGLESAVLPLDVSHTYDMHVVVDNGNFGFGLTGNLSIAPVPENSTLVLLLSGLVGVGLLTGCGKLGRVCPSRWLARAAVRAEALTHARLNGCPALPREIPGFWRGHGKDGSR